MLKFVVNFIMEEKFRMNAVMYLVDLMWAIEECQNS
jgi:hypothetical protein